MPAMRNPGTHYRRSLAALLVTLAAGCEPEAAPVQEPEAAMTPVAATQREPDFVPLEDPGYDPARDYFSFAHRDGVTLRHLELDLDVDFGHEQLRGHAILHLEPSGDAAPAACAQRAGVPATVTLDSRALGIERIRLLDGGAAEQDLDYRIGPVAPDPVRGEAITIELPRGFQPCDRFRVRIDYHTGPGATAIMWLPPELTAGGEQPFMFTQSQSIHARSWVPLQDTPAVRFTYEAVIRTPADLLAVMSADNDPGAPRDGEYRFTMPQPIPSYLLALAVGNLGFEPFGDRTGVYAEPEVLPAAAREFADTETMLETAEALWGPYQWGRYDLLILPPSFPYGGMENPRLSFLTPSLLAGDGSLVSVVAHELAHSWSGNLVSNATWRDIWLNEGITSYLEGRLMEQIYGRERADEERVLNYDALREQLAHVPPEMQPLAPRFDQGDPDEGQDGLEYTKGQLLLDTLEQRFGRAAFDPFLTAYFKAFAWQAITSEQFLDFLDEHLLQLEPDAYPRERVASWLYRPGVPEDAAVPVSASLQQAGSAAAGAAAGTPSAAELRGAPWSAQAWVHFVQALPADLAPERIADIDAALGLSATQNAEIARAWFRRVAGWRYRPAYDAMRQYLGRYGRIRLLRPVYEALASNGEDLEWAREVFATARAGYHPLTIAAIEPLLREQP